MYDVINIMAVSQMHWIIKPFLWCYGLEGPKLWTPQISGLLSFLIDLEIRWIQYLFYATVIPFQGSGRMSVEPCAFSCTGSIHQGRCMVRAFWTTGDCSVDFTSDRHTRSYTLTGPLTLQWHYIYQAAIESVYVLLFLVSARTPNSIWNWHYGTIVCVYR